MGKYLKLVDDLSDNRGTILVFSDGEKDYLIIYTKAGYMRGGEIHEGWQQNVILNGIIEWITPDQTSTHNVSDVIVTTKHIPHMMESVTDSLMVEWREKSLETPVNYHEPYRTLIKKRMQPS